jgi:hypothetical protein
MFTTRTLQTDSLAGTPEPFDVRRPEVAFEELHELKACDILKPELLNGPHYVIRGPVLTASGMNQVIKTAHQWQKTIDFRPSNFLVRALRLFAGA